MFDVLLKYSDNLEVIFLFFKLLQIIIPSADDCTKYQFIAFNPTLQAIIKSVIQFYSAEIRHQFPFIVELFKTEKFFKDTQHKPETVDAPTDQVTFKSPIYQLKVANIKKEMGEHFLSYLQIKNLLEKEGIKVDLNMKSFWLLVIALRTFKNFAALKQRTLVMLLMFQQLIISQKYRYDRASIFKTLQEKLRLQGEISDSIRDNMFKEWLKCLALKGMPLTEYYMELLQLMCPKELKSLVITISDNGKEEMDISSMKRFLEDLAPKYENEFQALSKKELVVYANIIGKIMEITKDVSYKAIFDENPEKSMADIDVIQTKASDIIIMYMENFEASTCKEEIMQALTYLLNHDDPIFGGEVDDEGLLGMMNINRVRERVVRFFTQDLLKYTEIGSLTAFRNLFEIEGFAEKNLCQEQVLLSCYEAFKSGTNASIPKLAAVIACFQKTLLKNNQELTQKMVEMLIGGMESGQFCQLPVC